MKFLIKDVVIASAHITKIKSVTGGVSQNKPEAHNKISHIKEHGSLNKCINKICNNKRHKAGINTVGHDLSLQKPHREGHHKVSDNKSHKQNKTYDS